jgi:hypothetical protein
MPEASANGNYSQYLAQALTPPFATMGAPQLGPQGLFGGGYGAFSGNSFIGGQPQVGAAGPFASSLTGQSSETALAPALAMIANYVSQQVPVVHHIAAVLGQLAQQAAHGQHGFGQHGFGQWSNPFAAYGYGQQGYGAFGQTIGQSTGPQLAQALGQLANQLAQQAHQHPLYGQANAQQIAWTLGQLANQVAQQSRFQQGGLHGGSNPFAMQTPFAPMAQGQGGYWAMPQGQAWGGIRPAMV